MSETAVLPDPDSPQDRKLRTELALDRPTEHVARPLLTAEQAVELAAQVPDDPVPLPGGKLACPVCGIATVPGSELVQVPLFKYHADGTVDRAVGSDDFARCPACEARRQLAERIVAAHPGAVRALGGIVTERTESVLAALAVLDRPLPDPSLPERELASLLRYFVAAGSARWPLRPGICAPKPFAHVRERARINLRLAYLRHRRDLAQDQRPPVRLAPPQPPAGVPRPAATIADACLFCGVGAVEVSALTVYRLGREAATNHVWTYRQVDPGSLGAAASPDKIGGFTCPQCTEAIRAAGAVGITAVENSYAATVQDTDPDLANAVRYGDLQIFTWLEMVRRAQTAGRPPAKPNQRPWQHVDPGYLRTLLRDDEPRELRLNDDDTDRLRKLLAEEH